MPRLKTDYSKTVIYKIVCNNLEVKDLYVGSTTEFTKRKSCHKKRCSSEKNKHYNLKVYQTIRANGGWENWSMLEIEKYECVDGNEARTRERFWYEQMEATLNMVVPIQNKEERKEYLKFYREEHTKERKEYTKIYRTEHPDKIKQTQKKYKDTHSEEIKQTQKKYKDDHSEEIKEYRKKYRDDHSEETKEYQKKYRAKKRSKSQ